MRMILEMKRHNIKVMKNNTAVNLRVFEDNSGVVEISKTDKHLPRKKHLNIKCHHFRSYIGKNTGGISIHKIDTTHQITDMLTKPLLNPQFTTLRSRIMGFIEFLRC